MIALTPKPPYYAVVFTSILNGSHSSSDNLGLQGYSDMADKMLMLAKEQDGYLGVESAREELGITVSYWESLDSIRQWKANAEHQQAQKMGREQWYAGFTVRIAKVEREYSL